jgi:histidine ammonia-lyase
MMAKTITIDNIKDILVNGKELKQDLLPWERINNCYNFLESFCRDKIIYGINTGFGPMAQWRVDDKSLKDLQYNIIRSHSTGAGEALSDDCVKSAMIVRLNQLAQGYSGVHPDTLRLLVLMINHDIIPFIPRHGSVGASGDLVQLAHMALCMLGEGKVHFRGEWCETGKVFKELGIKPLEIHIREGLSLTNGTSVMTGIGIVNQFDAEKLLDWAVLSSVWMNEVASSYDDFMAEPLQQVRRHSGQIEIARRMREVAKGSQLMSSRQHMLYDESHRDVKVFKHKVQAYYSLRCVPQVLGPILETVENSRRVLEEELNCASDNPIVDPETKNVYHGGNFHGDYISLEQDKVKIAMVRLMMTAERQLNYLFHDRINGILPPFLNMGTLGLNYGMQACQFTATSTTAESQTLAMPNYVHSIPNNNDNQDIVSMGTNSALLCKQVLDNAYQVMAIHMVALAQATDCLGIVDKLSPATRKEYDAIRLMIGTRVEDAPFYDELKQVEEHLRKK